MHCSMVSPAGPRHAVTYKQPTAMKAIPVCVQAPAGYSDTVLLHLHAKLPTQLKGRQLYSALKLTVVCCDTA